MISRPYTLGGNGDEGSEEPNMAIILFQQIELTENVTEDFLTTLTSHLRTRVEETWNAYNRGRDDQVLSLLSRISSILVEVESIVTEDSLKSVPTCILDAFTEAWNPPQ